MRAAATVIAAGTAALMAVAGYGALDVVDAVPGILTTDGGDRVPVALPGRSAAPADVRPPAAPAMPPAPGPSAAGPLDPAAVRAALTPLLGNRSGRPAAAVLVRDAQTGERLIDIDADAALIPASTTKVLTAYALARTLDLNSTLKTAAVLAADGQVLLKAGGDTALAPGAGNPDEVSGHAGLGDLAAQVATALTSQNRRAIRLGADLSYAPGPEQAPGWAQDLVPLGFTTKIAMMGLSTDRADPGTASAVDPVGRTVQAFADALRARGVEVTLGPNGVAPAAAPVLGTVESAPVADVMGLVLRDSDDGMAESLARQGAFRQGVPGDTPSVTAWITRTLAADGIDLRGVRLQDASGLADGSTIPTRVLAEVLVRGARGQGTSSAFQRQLTRLPVGGWNGTLHQRFLTPPSADAAGLVRAKTGTLPGVNTLAGTVRSRGGRLLVFAVISNEGAAGEPVQSRPAIDAVVAALARCACERSGA